jgi:alkylhydroperoxidase family enzyme
VLDDFTAAPIDEKLRATLAFLHKMTLSPEALGPADARAVLSAGVSREALEEAMEVAYLFNVYDRLADTMGWHVPAQESGYYQSSAKRLLSRGYR